MDIEDPGLRITLTRERKQLQNTVDITGTTVFVDKKNFSNKKNKTPVINMLAISLQQRDCTVIQTGGDADVDMVKSAVAISIDRSTSLIAEDTDILILLLYHLFKLDRVNMHLSH